MRKVELDFMISYRVEEMVNMLIEDYQMPLLKAFDKVYGSNTYQNLLNISTGLYFQSPGYIYSYLQEELS